MNAPFFGCAAIAASIIPFLNGSLQWPEAVAIGMIIVQACDAAIGVTIQDRMKTFGREELLLPLTARGGVTTPFKSPTARQPDAARMTRRNKSHYRLDLRVANETTVWADNCLENFGTRAALLAH